MHFNYLLDSDPELASAITSELDRQRNSIELIASENFVSLAVLEATGSPLTNKYAEGLPGRRYYGGCWAVDAVEDLARERAKKLFGAAFANVQPHSGAQANYAAEAALVKPGDTIMGMGLDFGGHLTHGSPANFSGKLYNIVPYGVSPSASTTTRSRASPRNAGPRSSSPAHPPTRASSTSSASPRSPTASAPSSWWIWPTSPASWRAGCTRAPSRTPTW